jgi:hypothetical protein
MSLSKRTKVDILSPPASWSFVMKSFVEPSSVGKMVWKQLFLAFCSG